MPDRLIGGTGVQTMKSKLPRTAHWHLPARLRCR